MKDKLLILIALILGFSQTAVTAFLSISIMSAIVQPRERVIYVTATPEVRYIIETVELTNPPTPSSTLTHTATILSTNTFVPTDTPIPTSTLLPTFTAHPVEPTKVIEPTKPSYPPDITAICKDGTYSRSKHASGTCSGHKGVREWINKPK